MESFPHGHYILRGNIRLDVVDRCKDKAAAGGQVIKATFDFIFHLLGSHIGKDLLGIHPATPKHQIPAKLLLQAASAHFGGAHFDRIEDIDSHLDKIGNELINAAARMEVQLDGGLILDEIKEDLLAGLDVFPIHIRGDERTPLGAQVVLFADYIHHVH